MPWTGETGRPAAGPEDSGGAEETARGASARRSRAAGSSSRGGHSISAYDVYTGRVLWRRTVLEGVGRYYDITGILALDLADGRELWNAKHAGGSQVTYSERHDLLVLLGTRRHPEGGYAGPASAVEGRTGTAAWELPEWRMNWGYKWGPMISRTRVISQDRKWIDLLTGERKRVPFLDQGERLWGVRKSHGCGPVAGSANLLTFRSGCAGFYDLAMEDGTGNLGGFRSGCTPNLIVGDGVLNAPDYTRACSCAYQNRSSLALIHMPGVQVDGRLAVTLKPRWRSEPPVLCGLEILSNAQAQR